ncbi:MAG: hypothetical protein KDA93_12215 [Planctomycetaceae bacterium]|nr:hypothetical protein [Planctomycetaceae bacterium]
MKLSDQSQRFFPVGMTFIAVTLIVLTSHEANAQLDFEAAPINYETAAESNRIAELAVRIEKGEVTLEYDKEHGYLKSLLAHLNVPISSQMLVYSKTSFQLRKISPRRPRAVYFNDDVYIGWVQRGDVIEISTADRELGGVFYTLSQDESEPPRFIRDRGQCLTCHASSRTATVPGHLVRSVHVDRSGEPFYGHRTFNTDHRSPITERWGGWYVSGTHGKQRHMGNVTLDKSDDEADLDREAGANVTDLDTLLHVAPYLSTTSDLVALMILEHQTQTHNQITWTAFETRSALHYDEIMNNALERPADYRSESATRRIESATEKLVDHLLFVDEYALEDPVKGTSGFAAEFAARGPFDEQGRSLRQLDLNQRLMKYPCSYLIYSEPFDHLPAPAKQAVYERLHRILTGVETDERYAHLTPSLRRDILDILRQTKHDLPDAWKTNG